MSMNERNSAATSRENAAQTNHEQQTGGKLAAAPCSAQNGASDKQDFSRWIMPPRSKATNRIYRRIRLKNNANQLFSSIFHTATLGLLRGIVNLRGFSISRDYEILNSMVKRPIAGLEMPSNNSKG